MYKLHDNVHLQSELSFVNINEELCKFPMEFVLKIISAYLSTIMSESSIKQGILLKCTLSSVLKKCIYYYFVHAHSLSTMTTAEALFNKKKKKIKKCYSYLKKLTLLLSP